MNFQWRLEILGDCLNFAVPKGKGGLAELVDCTGLENRRTARYRGFESLSLRQLKRKRPQKRAFFISAQPTKLASVG